MPVSNDGLLPCLVGQPGGLSRRCPADGAAEGPVCRGPGGDGRAPGAPGAAAGAGGPARRGGCGATAETRPRGAAPEPAEQEGQGPVDVGPGVWREATASSGPCTSAGLGTQPLRERHLQGRDIVKVASAPSAVSPCCGQVLGYSSALRVPGNSLILATSSESVPGEPAPSAAWCLSHSRVVWTVSCGPRWVGWAGSRNAEMGCRSCRINRLTGV